MNCPRSKRRRPTSGCTGARAAETVGFGRGRRAGPVNLLVRRLANTMTLRIHGACLRVLFVVVCLDSSVHARTLGESGRMPSLISTGVQAIRLASLTVDQPPYQELSPLMFARGERRLNPYHRAILDDVAIRLETDRDLLLQLTGFSIADEPNGYSMQRAQSAHNYLVRRKGVARSRIFISVVCSGSWETPEERRRLVLYTIPRTIPLHLWPYGPNVWNCGAPPN
jgi:hypothetical protein